LCGNKETMEAIRRGIPGNGSYITPAAIVVCGLAELIPRKGDRGEADCYAAVGNMLIAARESARSARGCSR
jgi:hypothetical protein